jgi:hypothetical protein
MPDFIDWKGKKFDAEKLSQVLKALPEFEVIPFSKIGNYKDVYRKLTLKAKTKLFQPVEFCSNLMILLYYTELFERCNAQMNTTDI